VLYELKKQIAAAGDVLVKEYIDDGYTRKFLDRPALGQLRADLKTDLFDVIYWLRHHFPSISFGNCSVACAVPADNNSTATPARRFVLIIDMLCCTSGTRRTRRST
jgi:hypothetical protein